MKPYKPGWIDRVRDHFKLNKTVVIYEEKEVIRKSRRELIEGYNREHGTRRDGLGYKRNSGLGYLGDLRKEIEATIPVTREYSVVYNQRLGCRNCGHEWTIQRTMTGVCDFFRPVGGPTEEHRRYHYNIDAPFPCPKCSFDDVTGDEILKDDIIQYSLGGYSKSPTFADQMRF
jgi:hypothetical protein